MRLSTRLGLGAALAVVPLLAAIGFSVSRIETLARSNERLAERAETASQLGVGVVARLDRIDEYLRKHTISNDAGYARLLEDTLQATQAELAHLEPADLSPGEHAALAKLSAAFDAFAGKTRAALAGTAPPPGAADLDAVGQQADALQLEARRESEADADTAREVRAQIQRTAITAALVAIALTVVGLWLTVRALRARLDHFIDGTEAVSAGTFSVQLDTSHGDELDRAATAFNHMVDALGELDRIKADFISSVSHELRTPLVAMQETTNLLLDEVVGTLTPRQRHMLELNTDAGRRLAGMIGELLDLGRVRAGVQRGEERDLVALTQVAVSQLEALALERGIELRTHVALPALPAYCDADRYVQVVQNLIGNALKYTPAGGAIGIHLERCEPGCALLRIEDSGPGIPAIDRDRVFEKFFRREGQPSDGGAGLGLAICREIVSAHGGSIWVDDARELRGAALHVMLPVSQGASA